MNGELLLQFVQNIILLMSLAVVYSVFRNNQFFHPIFRKILMGFMVSIIVVTIMRSPIPILEGTQFDTRAVVLSLSGIFLGLIPTIMGAFFASLQRISDGGAGAFTGVIWIIVSSIMGLVYRQFRLKKEESHSVKISWIELYVFGLVVQVVMVLLLFLLPRDIVFETINIVAFPLLVIYPIGSLFVAMFMLIQRKAYFNEIQITESEIQYRNLFNKSKSNLLLVNPENGNIVDVNETSMDTYGYSFEEFTSLNVNNVIVTTKENFTTPLSSYTDGVNQQMSQKHKKKNGKIFDVEVHSGLIQLDGKTFLYLTIIDVSQKMENMRLFKDADEQLKTTLLSVGEGIVVSDEHHRITLINDKAMSLLGLTQHPNRKKVFEVIRLYSNNIEKSFEELYIEALETGNVYRSDNSFQLLSPDDLGGFVEFTISPIQGESETTHGGVLVLRDVTIDKERQEEIQFMSQHDFLTNLYNRYHFEQEMKRLDVVRQLPISIIISDANGLKLLNDSLGHLEGDKLLKEISQIIQRATRSEDIVARWGGDEFTVLLPQTTNSDALKVVNRIHDLADKSLFNIIKPSISIGLATKTSELQDLNIILKQAEEIMYENKANEGKRARRMFLDRFIELNSTRLKDYETHVNNMEQITKKYASFYNLSEHDTEHLVLLTRFHDIGLIAIPPEIINHPGSLDDFEWSKVKTHPDVSSRIIAAVPQFQHLSEELLYHHENVDGTGYPNGVKLDEIPHNSRLLRIIDSYESMTSDKVYKQKMSHDEAITELLKYAGTYYDTEEVKRFIKIFEKTT